MFYSPSQNAWFDPAFRAEYEKHGSWPADAKEFPRPIFEAVSANRPANKIMAPDANGNPTLIDPPGASPNDLKALAWNDIKAERDRRRFEGGVKVGGNWFLSTSIATGEYNTLMIMSAGLPENTVLRHDWRTMDGAKVDMTPALVKQILVAGFAQVAAIDDAAQAHRAAMEASADPSAYDFSGGWPLTYADELAQQQE